MVLDASGTSWSPVISLSPSVVQKLDEDNVNFATSRGSWKDYERMVRTGIPASGEHCLQCDFMTHRKDDCTLKDANSACERCVKSNRPCAKLVKLNGELKVG